MMEMSNVNTLVSGRKNIAKTQKKQDSFGASKKNLKEKAKFCVFFCSKKEEKKKCDLL